MATTYFSTGDEKMFRYHVAEHLAWRACWRSSRAPARS